MNLARKSLFILACAGIVTAAVYTSGCGGNSKLLLDHTKPAFEKLSEYNLFKGNMADLVPNDELLPYDLNTPLFSDYAEKARFVFVPKKDGIYATYNNEDGLVELPVGSVLIKNFFYPIDAGNPAKGRRIIETRMLVHRENGWDADTYVWNADQTEAVKEIAGSQFPVSFVNKNGKKIDINYAVPNKNQCAGCHEIGGKITPIGPKLGNLNKDYHYADGVKNQLGKWVDVGILKELPKKPGTINTYAVWDNPKTGSLDARARAWLDVNCAHCHNPKGPAKNSGLDLRITQLNPASWGVMKGPVAAGNGAGNKTVDIDPGNPDNSILLYRLESTESEVMMPELGRSLVHVESVELIKDWILAMKPKVQ
jgi:uncharacterized repeat protein (TIGR03806 family)